MKKLLVLAAGILQVPIIKKAHEMGYYVIATDGNSNACGFKYADKAICTDITSEEKMLKIAIDEQIDGVIHPCSEVSMKVMGYINDKLNLSGISQEQAIRATNKHLMRNAFESENAPSPKSILTNSVEDAWNLFTNEFETDAILKPSRNSGSRGIAKIGKEIDKRKFNLLYNRALFESKDYSVLIEEFIEGPEFSVEIIVWDNQINVLTITDKKTTDSPYFVELGHNQPSCYSLEDQKIIKDAAVLGVKSLKVNNCACHAEVKLQNGKAYLMEIGARLGGDFISTVLTPLSTGIDMVAAAINCSLGIKPDLSPKNKKCGVCIRYFSPKPGKFLSINNKECLIDERVYNYEFYNTELGSEVVEIKSSLDRFGHVIVTDKTPALAKQFADYIVNNIDIITV